MLLSPQIAGRVCHYGVERSFEADEPVVLTDTLCRFLAAGFEKVIRDEIHEQILLHHLGSFRSEVLQLECCFDVAQPQLNVPTLCIERG